MAKRSPSDIISGWSDEQLAGQLEFELRFDVAGMSSENVEIVNNQRLIAAALARLLRRGTGPVLPDAGKEG